MLYIQLRVLLSSRLCVYLKHTRFKSEINIHEINSMSPTTVKKKIKNWFVNVEDGYTCFSTVCSFCNSNKKSTVKKIYVNKVTGYYLCICGKFKGDWVHLEKFLSSKTKTTSQKQISLLKESLIANTGNSPEWDNILKITTEEYNPSEIDEIKSILQIDINEHVLQTLQSRYDASKKRLYFPLVGCNLTNVIGYKLLKMKTLEESTFPVTDCLGVMLWKSSSKTTTAVIVSRVLDLISLARHKMNYDIICLPHNTSILPQQVLPLFEKYEKVVIWFNNDLQSFDAAKNFAKKLNEQRCFIVKPNENYLLPTSIESPAEFKKVMNSATSVWHRAITTFSALREDVLFDLWNIEKVEGIKWTRFPTLNRILKGHRRGELTILTGPTGSGKTTFMSEYSLDLAMQGVNTLWGSFEIKNCRLARVMLQQMSGIALEKNLEHFDFWADQFELLPLYFMTFHGQQSIKIVMEAVEHATYVHDIAHVIIDNLQFMMGTTDDTKHLDRFWKQDVIVAAFRTFATKKNCHVTLVIHPRKEKDSEDLTTSSIFGGAKASQEADNVLLIQDKRLTSVRGKKYLQVAKNRYNGDLGILPLEFDKSGLSYKQKKRKTDDKKDETKNEIITEVP